MIILYGIAYLDGKNPSISSGPAQSISVQPGI